MDLPSYKSNPCIVHLCFLYIITFIVGKNSVQESFNLLVLVEFGHIRYPISQCPYVKEKC